MDPGRSIGGRRLGQSLEQIDRMVGFAKDGFYASGPGLDGSIAAPQPVASRKRTPGARCLTSSARSHRSCLGTCPAAGISFDPPASVDNGLSLTLLERV